MYFFAFWSQIIPLTVLTFKDVIHETTIYYFIKYIPVSETHNCFCLLFRPDSRSSVSLYAGWNEKHFNNPKAEWKHGTAGAKWRRCAARQPCTKCGRAGLTHVTRLIAAPPVNNESEGMFVCCEHDDVCWHLLCFCTLIKGWSMTKRRSQEDIFNTVMWYFLTQLTLSSLQAHWLLHY